MSNDDGGNGDKTLLAALKKACPSKVRVFDAADDHRDIAISQRRNKWAQACLAIDAKPWVRCEMLDKAGNVLAYLEHDGPAGDLEDLGSTASNAAERTAQFNLKMMLEAQKVALSHSRQEVGDLLKGVTEVMRVNTEAIKGLASIMNQQVIVAADVAAMKATADAGGDMEQWIKLIEASPTLATSLGPLVGAIFKAIAGGKQLPAPPKGPTNGAPKAASS
jgi:hypothetical protein